ncbi:GntR family transcriptional regulator [Melghiribacillus thermohalophilus]|uniref:GntR family transcriptional regulator n=1 Tax=Melghiribacillus thermohalophilus TaxID=1324956 RepID=A0A4R3N1D2_9BACI|nr:GntR family transcriptional regulator [Melghiribacillus thermohalophilus]TCT21716.1 GntR family transcriptional regulator [Melghiribacillus thermohalophilus]
MVDTNNPVPFHYQIKETLKKEILDGQYQEKIPSERALMDRFSVSRTTVREAVNHLVHEGILHKIHGKGTFIARRRPVQDWLNSLHSFTETVRNMGMKPGSRLLTNKIVSEPEYVSEIIHEEQFYLIERLRTADSIPIAIERHYYSCDLGKQLSQFNLQTSTIYDLIEHELGIDMVEAEQLITCKPVPRDDAKNLEVPIDSNALYVERTITDHHGKMIEYYTSTIKPEMYVFRIKTKRHKARF